MFQILAFLHKIFFLLQHDPDEFSAIFQSAKAIS